MKSGALQIAIIALLVCPGCVSKQKARLQAQQAYMAGEQRALQEVPQRPGAQMVLVQGQVTNPLIPWTQDLTLARAIVAANYVSPLNPMLIRLTRNGQTIEILPGDLLKGKDMPLQPGDVIQIVQ